MADASVDELARLKAEKASIDAQMDELRTKEREVCEGIVRARVKAVSDALLGRWVALSGDLKSFGECLRVDSVRCDKFIVLRGRLVTMDVYVGGSSVTVEENYEYMLYEDDAYRMVDDFRGLLASFRERQDSKIFGELRCQEGRTDESEVCE